MNVSYHNFVFVNVTLSGPTGGGARPMVFHPHVQRYSLPDFAQHLIDASRKGDRSAQKALYIALLPYLRAVAIRYLRDESYAKDVLQESFVKLFRNLKNYDSDKGKLKGWAARIVINTCFNFNERVIDSQTDELRPERHDGPVLNVPSHEITDANLLRVVKQMPYHYFQVFNLHVLDGYSHKEIEKLLNISEALSRKHLSRAKHWLREKGATIINQTSNI